MKILERLPRETGRDYALRNIKKNIISLDLPPGSQVSEQELATEMCLSRTPVREALIELSKVSIIEIHPQKKSVVPLIDYTLIEEACFMRNLLECAVVEIVCDVAVPADVERLNANVLLQKFYLDNYSANDLMELDNEFHKLLFEIARKAQIFMLMRNITIHFDRVRSMALSTVKNGKIVQDHEDIMQAVIQKDSKAARALMDAHLNHYKIDMAAIRAAYPQYFK